MQHRRCRHGLGHQWDLCRYYLVASRWQVSVNMKCSIGTSRYWTFPRSAAEHVSSVTFAMKNKMNLSIGIALSSSLQIGLLVTPVLVIVGWIIGQPMTLFFEDFETVILFASVLIVNYLIQDARSNWLEGALLLVRFRRQTGISAANWSAFQNL